MSAVGCVVSCQVTGGVVSCQLSAVSCRVSCRLCHVVSGDRRCRVVSAVGCVVSCQVTGGVGPSPSASDWTRPGADGPVRR